MKQVIFKANDCKLKIIYKGYLDSENDWVRTRDILTVDGFKEEPINDYYLNLP